jgi:tetratricopeptide (TPR) repeat protein
MMKPRLLPLLPLCLGALFAGCQSTDEGTTVSDLFRAGDYESALALARTQVEDAPDDPYYAEVERMAEVGLLLDQARDLSFEGDHAGALALLFDADDIAPGHPVVTDWIGKVVGELADDTLIEASRASLDGDLERAVALYERALVYEPEDERAKEGVARSLILINYRDGLGEQYYTEGVRALREYWLGQANTDFAANGKYTPEDPRGAARREQVAELMAEDRVLMAIDLEQRELFHAARNEYRIALLYDEGNAEAADGLTRMDAEVEAFASLGEAERARLRGEFGQAAQAIQEGASLSEAQGEQFASAKIDLDEARWEKIYLEALDAEADGRHERSVKMFDLLLQETGYYEDAVQRRKTLLDMIDLADRLYTQALAAERPQVKRQKLEQITVFWPEYRNVQKLLEAFEQQR